MKLDPDQYDHLPNKFCDEVTAAVKGGYKLNFDTHAFWHLINNLALKGRFLKLLSESPNSKQALALVKEYVEKVSAILKLSGSKLEIHTRTLDIIGIPLSLSSVGTGIAVLAKGGGAGSAIVAVGAGTVATGGMLPVALICSGVAALVTCGIVRTLLATGSVNEGFRSEAFARFGAELGAMA